MSYYTANPCADYERHSADQEAAAEAAEQEALELYNEFMQDARTQSEYAANQMNEALDYRKGPTTGEALEFILAVAYGSDLVNAPAKARELIERMAQKWVDIKTDKVRV